MSNYCSRDFQIVRTRTAKQRFPGFFSVRKIEFGGREAEEEGGVCACVGEGRLRRKDVCVRVWREEGDKHGS